MKLVMRKLILVILVLAAGLSVLAVIFLPKSFTAEKEVIFIIQKGAGVREIALNLEKENLISWAPLFRIYVFLTGVAANLQAGTYLLSPSMNIPEIAGKLSKGEAAKIKLTFPEGSTAEQIYQKLIGVTQIELAQLKNFEGYLFPDTYEISYGTSAEEIVKMMTDNFNKKVTLELKEKIKNQGRTLEEVVIMASLLEKEVKTKEEKELAADVLWKRLKIGMALQVDAARETYERRGLPETPICNPGLESILAAIYPQSSPYWYYFSTPDGTTLFSKTLEEHNLIKAQYLKP